MEPKHFETNLAKENEYPKLVRDNAPEIMAQTKGRIIRTRILDNDLEFLEFLLKKVEEESYELAHAEGRGHLAEEVADMMELFDSLLEVNSLDWSDVMRIKEEKANKNGKFKKRILLLECEV